MGVLGDPNEHVPASGGAVLPSHRWSIALAALGAVLVVAFVAFAILTAAPPSAANLSSSTSDGVEPATLATADESAAIVVPKGWVVVREGDAHVVVLSPDGVMKVQVGLGAESAAEVVAGGDGVAGELRSETLASGLRVAHADLGTGGIFAAVEVPGGVVWLRSELVRDVDPAAYRPAFAALLEGVRP